MVLQFVGEYVVAFLLETLTETVRVFYFGLTCSQARFVAFAAPIRLKPRVFRKIWRNYKVYKS